MQAQLPEGISILGVNGAAYSSGNDRITEGRTLPWLQDTSEVNMWSQWQVSYRDVVVRDPEGKMFGVFNLTSKSLESEENVTELLNMALDAAGTVSE